jgi:hypothetical protein
MLLLLIISVTLLVLLAAYQIGAYLDKIKEKNKKVTITQRKANPLVLRIKNKSSNNKKVELFNWNGNKGKLSDKNYGFDEDIEVTIPFHNVSYRNVVYQLAVSPLKVCKTAIDITGGSLNNAKDPIGLHCQDADGHFCCMTLVPIPSPFHINESCYEIEELYTIDDQLTMIINLRGMVEYNLYLFPMEDNQPEKIVTFLIR